MPVYRINQNDRVMRGAKDYLPPAFLIRRRVRIEMGTLWETTDFEKTIRDFEFTRRAARRIGSVIYSAKFEEMDSRTIFQYLLSEMELVSFKDYLKRYIYERVQFDIPLRRVPDEVYRRIIMDSFKENGAPHSFEPVTKKWSSIVRRWLTQDNVRRQTIFLLGFGLRMNAEDVSEFLVKVLKEEDFRISDPVELVYQYCFEHDLRYQSAQELLRRYDYLVRTGVSIPKPAGKGLSRPGVWQRFHHDKQPGSDIGLENINSGEMFVIDNDDDLMRVLLMIRKDMTHYNREEIAYKWCMYLAARSRKIIAEIYQRDEEESGSKKKWTEQDISFQDMEKVICSGIPVNTSGNLQKMSASLLYRHFSQRRFSRQRMDGLTKRHLPVERFDLITLLFFIYSQERENDEPEVRCKAFVEEMNGILRACGMMGLYSVNPYEAFVLMCLLSECPLAVYSDVWEMSYAEEQDGQW